MATINVYNPNGELGEIEEDQLQEALKQGYKQADSVDPTSAPQEPAPENNYVKDENNEVYVISPDGEMGVIPESNIGQAQQDGFKLANQTDLDTLKYEQPVEQAKTFGENVLGGISAGVVPAIGKELGLIDREASEKRAEVNPGLAMGGEVAGGIASLATGAGAPAAISKGVAKVVGKKLVDSAATKTLAGLGSSTLINTGEGALYEGIKSISKNIHEDPEKFAELVFADTTKGGLYGGVGGAIFKGLGNTVLGKFGKSLDEIKNQKLPLTDKFDEMSDNAAIRLAGGRTADFEKMPETTKKEVASLIRKAVLNKYDESGQLVDKNWIQSLGTNVDEIETVISKELDNTGNTVGTFETKFNEFVENPENFTNDLTEITKKAENKLIKETNKLMLETGDNDYLPGGWAESGFKTKGYKSAKPGLVPDTLVKDPFQGINTREQLDSKIEDSIEIINDMFNPKESINLDKVINDLVNENGTNGGLTDFIDLAKEFKYLIHKETGDILNNYPVQIKDLPGLVDELKSKLIKPEALDISSMVGDTKTTDLKKFLDKFDDLHHKNAFEVSESSKALWRTIRNSRSELDELTSINEALKSNTLDDLFSKRSKNIEDAMELDGKRRALTILNPKLYQAEVKRDFTTYGLRKYSLGQLHNIRKLTTPETFEKDLGEYLVSIGRPATETTDNIFKVFKEYVSGSSTPNVLKKVNEIGKQIEPQDLHQSLIFGDFLVKKYPEKIINPEIIKEIKNPFTQLAPIKITGEDVISKINEVKKSLSEFGETKQIIDGKEVMVKNRPMAGNTAVLSRIDSIVKELEVAKFPTSGKLSLKDLLNLKRFLDPKINYQDPIDQALDQALYKLRKYAQDEALKGIDEAAKNPRFAEMVGITPEQYRQALKTYGAAKGAARILNKEMARENARKPLSGLDAFGTSFGFFSMGPGALAALGIKKGIQKYQEHLLVMHLTSRPGTAGGLVKAQAAQQKIESKINNAIKSFVKGAKQSTKESLPYSINIMEDFRGKKDDDRMQNFKNTKKFIEDLQDNPEKLQRNLETSLNDLNEIDPDLYVQAVSKSQNALTFLASKLPVDPIAVRKLNPMLSKWKPNDTELRKFERYLSAIDDPMSILDDMNRGILTPEGAEVLKSVYPRMYENIHGQILENVAQLQEELPYKKRLQLSIMFGTPVDPSLNPSTIARLQSNFLPEKEKQMKSSGSKSMGNKISNLQGTTEQITKKTT